MALLVLGMAPVGCASSRGSAVPSPRPSPSPSIDPLLAFDRSFETAQAGVHTAIAGFSGAVGTGDVAVVRSTAARSGDAIDAADKPLHAQPAPLGLADQLQRLLNADQELSDGLRAINDHRLDYNQAVRDVIEQAISLRNRAADDVRSAIATGLKSRGLIPAPAG